MAENEMYDGIPPAMRTNTAQESRLVLKANFRPMISAEKPQIPAPTKRPTCEARGMPDTWALGSPYSC